MFEGSLVESTALLGQRNRWPVVLSISLQAFFAAAFIAIPLLHPEVMALHAPQLALYAPPPKPPQPPAPPPQHVHLVETPSEALRAPAAAATVEARAPSRNSFSTAGNPDLPASTNVFSMGIGPSLPFAATSGGGPAPTVVVRAAAAPSRPLSVSSGVTNGLLLAPIRPAYPSIARAARIEGTVIIQAVISKTGRIESAHVMEGPAMLQGAALDAMRGARYRPYLLNNEPVEVETTISITFRMSS